MYHPRAALLLPAVHAGSAPRASRRRPGVRRRAGDARQCCSVRRPCGPDADPPFRRRLRALSADRPVIAWAAGFVLPVTAALVLLARAVTRRRRWAIAVPVIAVAMGLASAMAFVLMTAGVRSRIGIHRAAIPPRGWRSSRSSHALRRAQPRRRPGTRENLRRQAVHDCRRSFCWCDARHCAGLVRRDQRRLPARRVGCLGAVEPSSPFFLSWVQPTARGGAPSRRCSHGRMRTTRCWSPCRSPGCGSTAASKPSLAPSCSVAAWRRRP